MHKRRTFYLLLAVLLFGSSLFAQQREAVLKQIDHPHPYYFREMYLPQLTTGPSAVAWSPDSKSAVYSMGGSLWRQKVDSTVAEQLTSGPGYDYQPDWSHDGRWIVYAKYANDAVELWTLDTTSGQTRQLTNAGAVNVEPRFSPDGKRVAFVSTSYHGRFHIFTAAFVTGELKDAERMTGENRSPLPRYYYSPFDHEISPAWSPDGSEILFVSNRGHIYGTGGFWRMKAVPGAEAREIHYEETNWKARPEFSPDGKRIVYASYLGQPWHQLWTMPAQGGDPFPLSYGDFDNINPRWSPDGRSIAFISNRSGNTSLWIQEIPGGAQREVIAKERRYLKPMAKLSITVLDASGKPTAARVFVTGEDGRAYAPDDAWMHADDNFVRSERPFEAHYFHTTGRAELTVPVGNVDVEVIKGFEFEFAKRSVNASAGQTATVTIKLRPLKLPSDAAFHWVSGDVHVHMNYGGAYRNTPKHLVMQASAENLSIIENLVVNKEQRIPDINYFSSKPDPASTASNLLVHGQEFHTSYWGHLGLLHLTKNFLIPDYVGYVNTSAASLFPSNANVADMAHAQDALVGYVHPFDAPAPDPEKDESLTNELPVDVALGKVDYIEALGFADHKATYAVWYRLLNCGFHLPAAAGTDAMANYASLRGPVGLNRVYAKVPVGPLKIEPWLQAIKSGKTFATNGPLLGFRLSGKEIGSEVDLPAGGGKLNYNAWMRSIVPIDHLQIICNGKVARDLELPSDRNSLDAEGEITLSQSGWCLLRAWSEKAEHPVLDQFPYATTSPIYVSVAGSPIKSPDDGAYFVAWIDRLIEAAKAHKDWNTDSEKATVLSQLQQARAVYARQ
ncbi:MAG TPA: CehA/McbA family metallohydrolase [Terriglobales bacterium]|jgi:Tol biopolymer transport system component|nr:CehA/McbA family metallohydrolase [Terriglobales bacterium]